MPLGYRVDGWHTTWTSRWRRLYVKCSCKCVVCGTKHAFVVLPFEVEVDGERYEQAGYFGNDINTTPMMGPPTTDAASLGDNLGDIIEASSNAHNNGILSHIESAMSTSKHGENICSKLKVKCDKTGKKEAYE